MLRNTNDIFQKIAKVDNITNLTVIYGMNTRYYLANRIKTKDAWHNQMVIGVDDIGKIKSLTPLSESPIEHHQLSIIPGVVLPTVADLHSHSFQRLMAAKAEYTTASRDHFWTWRELMYKIANDMSLEAIELTTQMLYIELLKGGYGAIAEFQYLHHPQSDQDLFQKPKNQQLSLISQKIIDVSHRVSLPMTMVPAHYLYSQFDRKMHRYEQRRFICEMDEFKGLSLELSDFIKKHQWHRTRLGLAGHSLRASDIEDFHQIVALSKEIDLQGLYDGIKTPLHLHIAEQMGEVNACLAHYGKRPLAFFDDEIGLSTQWTCVHATHLDEDEVLRLARSQAVAGLCPSTEGNLGDGFFELPQFLKHCGILGIGSDSQISTSVAQELKTIEYVQRLRTQRRGASAMHLEHAVHIGEFLYEQCAKGGAQSLGHHIGVIEVGAWADFMVLDDEDAALYETSNEYVLDQWVFHPRGGNVYGMLINGNWVIREGKHPLEQETELEFRKLLKAFYA